MFEACREGELGVCKWLVENGSPLRTASRPFKQSNLLVACAGGHLRVVSWLLGHEAVRTDVRTKDSNGWTPLFAACEVGDLKLAQVLYEAGAAGDLRERCNDGRTPMVISYCLIVPLWACMLSKINASSVRSKSS